MNGLHIRDHFTGILCLYLFRPFRYEAVASFRNEPSAGSLPVRAEYEGRGTTTRRPFADYRPRKSSHRSVIGPGPGKFSE